MWLVVFFGAALLMALTPGANNLVGLYHAMHQGAGKALAGLCAGRLGAFVLMIAAVAAGLGPLLASSELALTIIKLAGVCYLVWLGGRILVRAIRTRVVPDADAAQPVAAASWFSVIRKEFLVAITNPKAVLIFTAFMPQFVDGAHGPVPLQVLVLGAVYLLAEAVAGTAYVLIGAGIKRARTSLRTRRNLDFGTGLVLLGMAGALATSRG